MKLTALNRKEYLRQVLEEGGLISTLEMMSDICQEEAVSNPAAYWLWAADALDRIAADLFVGKATKWRE